MTSFQGGCTGAEGCWRLRRQHHSAFFILTISHSDRREESVSSFPTGNRSARQKGRKKTCDPSGVVNFYSGLFSINLWLLRSHNYWFWLLQMTPAGSYVYRKTRAWKLPTPAGSYVYWYLYQGKYPKIPPLKSGAGMTSSPGGWIEAEVERHATPPGSWTYITG